MDGQLASRVRLIRTELPHVKTRIFTNGALLTHSRADELAESGIHAVTFSLHAATETTYQSVMRLSGFERTKERIEYFANVAAGRDIRIKVTIVDLTLTAGESDDTKKYWADRGIDAYVTRAVNWAGNLSDESTLPTYLLESETDPCHRVMREMYISASGNVILCCADWREEVVFGSIRTAPLETIWRSDEFRTYRKRHWDRRIESLPLCNRCTYARRRRAVPSPAGE
jgi:radical SAM protein with 4Fe4S-binding SPASM domain